ncbi:MAG: glycosyltransferase family 2 protein [Oscillospiraceae bacterium]|nr:glycosyltransferase family 2 protein [Oscillospiraceae bacterium]
MKGAAVFEIISLLLMLLTTVFYSYQIIYLLLPLVRGPKPPEPAPPKRYAILIAARNEEHVLPHLLDSIAAQTYPADRITTYVVADNCTDRTAEEAQAHGARVFRRFDTERVGKGYALSFLLDQIHTEGGLDRFDAFLVFDADNLLDKDYVNQINKLCAAGYPAFCGYRNTKNYGSGWLAAGYGLWYIHESAHLNRSRMALGTCCTVSGTGFGFTRQLLEEMGGWNYHTLTEDIEFSTWCATHGIRIGYCHDAILYDEQPTAFGVSIRQRTRWVQGGIQVSLRRAGDLLRGLLRGGMTAWASFEAITLSLWGYGMSAVSFSCTLLAAFLAGRWTGLATAVLAALVGGYVSMFAIGALTMATERRRVRATRAQKFRSLFTFPLFLFTYIPIALTAVFRKFEWTPIAHTCAISAAQLQDQSTVK